MIACLISTVTPKESMQKGTKLACFPNSKLLILENFMNFMNTRFYVWMGISIIALAAGFIILYS